MKYTIGIDFGSLSGRALLVSVDDGREIAESVYEYPHAVCDRFVPDTNIPLGDNFALQHPRDYIDVLSNAIPDVMAKAGIGADDIVGIGIDFTSCTMLPVFADGTPVCFDERFSRDAHAYVKLWKHHASQSAATQINELAKERGEEWISRYGNFIDSEWFFPKLLETAQKSPAVYDAADYFLDAGDWIVWQLTGSQARSYPFAAYKAMYNLENGFPSKEYFKALDPKIENVVEEKLVNELLPIGSLAGGLCERMAGLTGLRVGTPVATAFLDAYAAIPAIGAVHDGDMLAVMGTSMPMLLVSSENKRVPGICGVMKDGMVPGLYGYEAGICCMGDHFAWFTENCVPDSYKQEAKAKGISVIAYLTEKAEALAVGESGLIALDWWNGNRSTLIDADLSGLFVGLTLSTRPEEMYRALIEATAFEAKHIIENYRRHGVNVGDFIACGGISHKNTFLMQIYADVLGMEIKTVESTQTPARGSAILGALAAGVYPDYVSASEAMKSPVRDIYRPDPAKTTVYNELFAEYEKLYDYFGRGENNVMKKLRTIRRDAKKGN